MNFEVEEATSDDIDAMNELFAEEDDYHRKFDPGMFRKSDDSQPARPTERLVDLIESRISSLLVARSGGEVVGLASVTLTERTDHPLFVDRKFAVLEDVVVRKEHRRRGVGTALVRHAERWASGVGATALELGVWTSNEVAQQFYERLGYVTRFVKMTRSLGGEEKG